jgi:PAS domain S-box-containing protein
METSDLLVFRKHATNSKLRQALKVQRMSDEFYQAILQTSMDGFWLVDTEGRLLEVNNSYCQMSGYSSQELLSMHVTDLEAVETTSDISAHIEKIITQGGARFESRHCRKDGSVFDVEISVQHHPAEGGRIVVFLQDITERKQSFKQINDLAQRLQLAVSSANLGVWDWIIRDNRMFWNDRMFELYGITRETFPGNVDAWVNGLHPEDKEAAVAASQAAVNGEKKFDTVFRICHPGGTVKYIKADALVIRGTDGTAERMIGINADITEMKLAEEERKKLEDQLLLQSRLAAMGEMISNIAHQWRQPLNQIGLIVQGLQISFASGELTKAEFDMEIDAVMQNIMYMSNTINDFSNFFRQDKYKRVFLISEAVTQSVGLITATLQNSHIEIELQLEEKIKVSGFKNEYIQALLNILANAKDVLLERNIKEPRITIRTFRENNLSIVTVCDNGGGIDDSILPKVFESNFTTKGPGHGTGIGLYMSKVIIEKNMGGRLSVSNIQGGAEFRIEV